MGRVYLNTVLDDAGNSYTTDFAYDTSIVLSTHGVGDYCYYPVTSDDEFLYVGTLDNVFKLNKYTFEEVKAYVKSAYYAPIIYDTDFIYVSDGSDGVCKLDRFGLLHLGHADYGGIVLSVTQDDTHIYAGGYSPRRVRKYAKSDMSMSVESESLGGDIRRVIYDGDNDVVHVLKQGSADTRLQKLQASDLTHVEYASGVQGSTLTDMKQDGNYLYILNYGHPNNYLTKVNKTTYQVVDVYTHNTNMCNSISIDNIYIYAIDSGNNIRFYNKNGLSSGEIANYTIPDATGGSSRGYVDNNLLIISSDSASGWRLSNYNYHRKVGNVRI